jgi:signal transduction histidine kinase
MAMQSSSELADVSYLLNKQVVELGIPTRGCAFNIYNEHDSTEWFSNLEGTLPTYKTPREKVFLKYYEAGKRGETLFIEDYSGKKIKDHYKYLLKAGLFGKDATVETIKAITPEVQIDHLAYFKYGYLLFITLIPAPEAHDIFKRFAKEFEQTYTRFLDLQKAEAQAREAQIEAGLERVRSKTMAMHNSQDVGNTVASLFDELVALGLEKSARCGIGILDESDTMELWTASTNDKGELILSIGHLNMTLHPLLKGVKKTWGSKKQRFTYELQGDDLLNYFTSLNDYPDYHIYIDVKTLPEEIIHNSFYFTDGLIYCFTQNSISEDLAKVVKRFAGVFGQTYKRYLDLRKAEAQAREAQIEVALERVRAQAMAMHQSEDLGKTIMTYYEQLDSLIDSTIVRCGAGLLNKENTIAEMSTASKSPEGETYHVKGTIDMQGHPLLDNTYDHWLKQKEYSHVLRGNEIKEYYQYISNQVAVPENKGNDELYFYFPMFTEGSFYVVTSKAVPEDELQIFRRFSSVLSLTYRRFNDLQKAEAQAREAQIEAALERVRGKAMAMRSSEDLSSTASLVFTELRKLDINPIRCGVGLLSKETSQGQLYVSTSPRGRENLSLIGWVNLEGHAVLEAIYQSWINGEDYFPVLSGESMRAYYKQLLAGLSLPNPPNLQSNEKQYGHFFPVSVGQLYAWSEKPYNEHENKILKRFASVIDLTFRRYLELQKSESAATEAIRQASLDRVRAEIASMRTTTDLERITPLIWKELTTLNVPFIRCGVFIMDESLQQIHTFLSTPDGKAIAAFHLPYEAPGRTREIVVSWNNKEVYIEHWDETAFSELGDLLVQQGALPSKDVYLKTVPQGGVHLHCLPFMQGMLYVGNSAKLKEDDIQLIQSVADAFSTAYARYEDFNKLEAAKQQVDKTLVDLKQTQQQLVQSEKMASLGELTAGIAHEIQNPLNFVNNFSEVNKELLAEMDEAIQKGEYEEARALARDLTANQEKINHHGKRAEGIVKGMLQHSRGSNGQKEPTDINALCDEYLRLSYHGYRAKDKSFNVKVETEFDETLAKVNVVPQDIGRVVLNLINNAFYAVKEKSASHTSGYMPQVVVSTKNLGDNIEIAVKDNGNGIPDRVKEKIFQPFFTTKPTGQGTGLGLSLSYDIVKGHGGTIEVTTSNSGTEFVIRLPIV